MIEGNINKIQTYLEKEYGLFAERGDRAYIQKQMGCKIVNIDGMNIIIAGVKHTEKEDKIIWDEYKF